MLHKEIPFLRIGLPMCAGIVSGLYFNPDIKILVCSVIVIISGFVYSLLFNKFPTNLIYGFALTLSLFICGLLLYKNEKTSISVLKPEKALYTCTLCDYPEEKENSLRMTIRLNTLVEGNRSIPLNGSLLIYNKKDSLSPDYMPGDLLIIRCAPVEIANRGNPYEFDYKFFMENQGIRYYAFTRTQDIIRQIKPAHRKLIYKALIIREKIIQIFRECGIKGERLALVAAITLGQKSMLDPEQKMNFMKAGVMHIMAVSGLHAIIISLFVLNALFFMRRKFNTLRILITILVLWAFAFVTGLTPSVLRATMMFSFLQAGKLMKRPSNGINSVLASAFFLIIIRPSVIFDAGFLLSYSAVIYIICFYQDFYLLHHFKNWLGDKIWQSVAVTLVAQAGTLPLTMMLFNRFPTYFILANITIVPVSNMLIITGCLIPIFFRIHLLSHLLAILLNHLTGLTEFLTAKTASLPYSTIEDIGLTIPVCILLTCTIFLFSWYLLRKKSIPLIYPVVFLALFIFTGAVTDIFSKRTNELIVYSTPGVSTIAVKTGKMLILYSDTSLVTPEVRRHSAVLNLKINPNPLGNKSHLIKAGGKKILITRILNNRIIKNSDPDILIVTGSDPDIQNDLNLNSIKGGIIVTSQVKSGFHFPDKIANTCSHSIHFVRTSGAFICRL